MLHKLDKKLILLLFISSIILIINLGSKKVFFCDDEYLYIKIAAEMFETGEIWTPLWLGKEAFYKPPFNYWLMMVFYLFFGVKFIVARISIAFTALLSVYFLYKLGKKLYGEKEAYMAGLIFSTSFGFVVYGKVGMMDIPFTLFIISSIFYFYKAFMEKSSFYASIFLILASASILVKGPVSIAILFLFSISFLSIFGGWKIFFNLKTLWGWLAGFFILILWPVGIYFSGNFDNWYNFFILRENFGKFADSETYTFLDLLPYYFQYIFPWSLIFIFFLPLAFIKKHLKSHSFAVPLLWAFSVLFIFLLPETKLKHYTIPAIPTAGLIISGVWYKVEKHILIKVGLYSSILIFLLSLIILPVILILTETWLPFLLIIVTILTNILIIFFLIKKDLLSSIHCYALFLILLIGTASFFTFEPFPDKSFKHIGNSSLVAYKKQTYLHSYYMDRKVLQIESEKELAAVLEEKSKVIISEGELKKALGNDEFELHDLNKLYTWEQWKPSMPVEQILNAIKNSDSSDLREKVYLIEKENYE